MKLGAGDVFQHFELIVNLANCGAVKAILYIES
jgi:hypothetical protein